MVGETGLEPVWLSPRHFKCLVYPNSTTRPSSKPRADVSSRHLTVSHAQQAVSRERHRNSRMEGGGRNRTGVHGFAGRCMTTLPPRREKKGKRSIRGGLPSGNPSAENAAITEVNLKVSRNQNAAARPSLSQEFWSGKRGSNSRPQPWQGCALPTELFPHLFNKNYRPGSPVPATIPASTPGAEPLSGNTPSTSA
jgi:hypothetical protein